MQGLKNLQPLVNPILHNLELNSKSCEKKKKFTYNFSYPLFYN